MLRSKRAFFEHSLVVVEGRQTLQKASAATRGTSTAQRDTIPSPPQSVLGALIAVNLKNSLKQLADPFYLWKKSKLDCVSAWGRLGGRGRVGRPAPRQVFGGQEGSLIPLQKVGSALPMRSCSQPLANDVPRACPAQLSTLKLSTPIREA